MSTFGERLRVERERRHVTLEEMSEATRIARHHLEALEADDFARLPADVFNTGYVRAYAQFIGLDPEPLVEAYARARQSREPEGSQDDPEVARALVASVVRASAGLEGAPGPRPGAGRRVAPAIAVAAVLGAAAGWVFLRDQGPGATTGAVPAATPITPPTASPGAEAPPATTASRPSSGDGQAAPVAEREGRLSIPESGVGSAVVDRQLLDRGDRFPEGARVWFWTRVVGGTPGERVRHVWLREGRAVDAMELTLGGPAWRTYSHKTLYPGSAGPWAVEARDSAGRVLAREEFACVAGPGG